MTIDSVIILRLLHRKQSLRFIRCQVASNTSITFTACPTGTRELPPFSTFVRVTNDAFSSPTTTTINNNNFYYNDATNIPQPPSRPQPRSQHLLHPPSLPPHLRRTRLSPALAQFIHHNTSNKNSSTNRRISRLPNTPPFHSRRNTSNSLRSQSRVHSSRTLFSLDAVYTTRQAQHNRINQLACAALARGVESIAAAITNSTTGE